MSTERVDVLDDFKPTGHGNYYMDRGGYGVSYNPRPGSGIAMFASDDGGAETALVVDGAFFILNGDFRREYAGMDSLSDCLSFFVANANLASSWSNDAEDALARIGGP